MATYACRNKKEEQHIIKIDMRCHEATTQHGGCLNCGTHTLIGYQSDNYNYTLGLVAINTGGIISYLQLVFSLAAERDTC